MKTKKFHRRQEPNVAFDTWGWGDLHKIKCVMNCFFYTSSRVASHRQKTCSIIFFLVLDSLAQELSPEKDPNQ